MKNIIFGLACYVVFLICEWSNINPVEAIILLSVLLFIPMSFCIIDKRKEMDRNYYFINPYRFISNRNLCNASFRHKLQCICASLVCIYRNCCVIWCK